jgi:hypothetical protein
MTHELPNEERTELFRRNPHLESLLEQLNTILQGVSIEQLPQYDAPRYPIIFVVGGPRSGTTLIMQWLAASGLFGYPSNLLARFYQAPYIGALIHEMLFNPKLQYKNDFTDLKPYTLESSFNSDLGKTSGAAAPNVFWYFWRRFFDFGECPYLNQQQQRSADTKAFVKELAALESVFAKPFALKGIIVNWNLDFINRLFDKVLFIHVRRIPSYQMQSILRARERFRGDRQLWWGFKPPDFETLKLPTAEEQVAAQVFFTRKAIARSFGAISNERYLEVDYEQFCETPELIYQQIVERMMRQQFELPSQYTGTGGFKNSNGSYDREIAMLEQVYGAF